MPIAVSHDRNEKRTYSGERFAGYILTCLNPNLPRLTKTPENVQLVNRMKKRVLGFMNALSEAVERIHSAETDAKRREQAIETVNDLLAAYPMRKTIELNLEQPKLLRVEQLFLFPRNRKRIKKSRNPVNAFIASYIDLLLVTEPYAVHGLVSLAEAGLLDRLQLCACGKWYFGRFSHQRFCSAACRVKFWEDSDARKEQKRQRARENYLYNKAHKRS